jgi:L-2-hydroxyglutarate oxidase LhgO
MAHDIECTIVGAGVVGLAIARALARAGREVIVVEAERSFGMGVSSRNSEVIHAGLYYPPGSLKARLCVAGRKALYAYCAAHHVAVTQPGKLIVATDAAQAAQLADIATRARANGVDDLEALSAAQARTLEPALSCEAALLSPSTGIVDSHGLMLALKGDAEAAGASFAFATPCLGGCVDADGLTLDFGGDAPMRLKTKRLVNAAGLHAPALARALSGRDARAVPRAFLCKGNYFSLAGRAPFSRLIYPAPEAAGLGVHLTLDMGGQAKFGPDVEWIDHEDYRVDPARAAPFYAAIRRYWPGLPDGALTPAYAGIRPKITPPGAPAADFRIDGPAAHGVAGLVELFGIESPGLTSALAIGDHVAALLT